MVGEQTLRDLVKEWKATHALLHHATHGNPHPTRGTTDGWCQLPVCLLEFRSNNERHRPVMQALELVKRFAYSKGLCTKKGTTQKTMGVI